MATPLDAHQNERPNTYFVQERQTQEELIRLVIQDQVITESMGGPLAEQADPTLFQDVLDIACGTGGWIIEAARAYPTMSLVGVDISRRMLEYASEQARINHIDEQTKFLTMDAQGMLGFPKESFDLVNLRFGSSFMRTWEWRKLVIEMLRVTRPGGIIRLTDYEVLQSSTSPALTLFCEMLLCALYRAGHFFEQKSDGLTAHLAPLLEQCGCQFVQTRPYPIEYQASTKMGEAFYKDGYHAARTLRPFLEKWGCVSVGYNEFYRQLLEEIQRTDFQATLNFQTIWGQKPE